MPARKRGVERFQQKIKMAIDKRTKQETVPGMVEKDSGEEEARRGEGKGKESETHKEKE